jgi:Transposase DDE domain group 1
MASKRETLGQAECLDSSDRVVLDMDTSERPLHSEHEGGAYKAHLESVCYHQLYLSNRHGDCLTARLCPGKVHSDEEWGEMLLPEIECQEPHLK